MEEVEIESDAMVQPQREYIIEEYETVVPASNAYVETWTEETQPREVSLVFSDKFRRFESSSL